MKRDLTHELLKRLLDYDPETGVFTWRARTPDLFRDTERRAAERSCRQWNSCWAGTQAGSPNNEGYIQIEVFGRSYKAHVLAWFYMTGLWPSDKIDHRDLSRDNNKWNNLREANHSQNKANMTVRCDNELGVKGVRKTRSNSYMARIRVHGEAIYLGTFKTQELASAKYAEAAQKHFGEFARS